MRAASIPELRASAAAVLVTVVVGCAGYPDTGEMREYQCDDGLTMRVEVTEVWVRIHTVTGTVELARTRDGDRMSFSNGLRSLVLEPDGSARHSIGRRAWAECKRL